jgi:hypothetical protein
MRYILNCLLALTSTSIFVSCGNSNNTNTTVNSNDRFYELEKASWLVGNWQNISSEGNATEIWERKNDSAFSAKSLFIVGNDTVSSETITLEQHGKELSYNPTVKGQNNNQPIKFILTSSTENLLVFENPEHDFPQLITYTLLSQDSLVAEISGIMEGKYNSQKFPLTRAK